MQAIYEVPVIPNNLRHEETIVQIADVLNFVCDVFDDIISKVNIRIDANKTRLSNLTDRINVSAEKIGKLTGTKKATQVFSSSKYPASDIHKRYKSIFTNDSTIKFLRTKMKIQNPTLSDHPLEKLQFYHVKVSEKYKQKSKYVDVEEGLGSFPNDIESINELLLFNTSKNPYKNYVMSDPLQAIQYTREIDESNVTGPDAAPLSITQRTAGLNRSIGENYFYSPGLGNVPTIDVPLDLPDLPGVADDLRYLMESGPGIAPSVTTTPIVPDLPSVIQSPNDTVPNDMLPSVTDNLPLPPLPSPSSIHAATAAAATTTITPPPPPIIEQVQRVSEESIETTSAAQIIKEPITRPALNNKSNETAEQKPLPVVEDARASLMAAIRKAGGAKKANLRNTEDKREENSKVSSESNLMDDLNAKLALRRKGISGTKMSDGSEMNSALSRVSAMIPPPSTSTNEPNESTNTEDEDWD